MTYQQGKYLEIKTNSTTASNQAHISNSSFQNRLANSKQKMML